MIGKHLCWMKSVKSVKFLALLSWIVACTCSKPGSDQLQLLHPWSPLKFYWNMGMFIFYMTLLGCFASVLEEFNSHGRDVATEPKIKTVWHKTQALVLNIKGTDFVFWKWSRILFSHLQVFRNQKPAVSWPPWGMSSLQYWEFLPPLHFVPFILPWRDQFLCPPG